MSLYSDFLEDHHEKELEYRIPIDKTQYDTISRFMTNTVAKEEPSTISLNILLKNSNVRMSI